MGSRPRGWPKRTWLQVVPRDCRVCGLSNDDAMLRGRWRKMIRMVDEQEGVSGWMFLLLPSHPGRPGQSAVKRSCVCSGTNSPGYCQTTGCKTIVVVVVVVTCVSLVKTW